MYQTPRNYGQTSHPSFDIVVVMSFQFFSLDRWKTWSFSFQQLTSVTCFLNPIRSCPPGGTMSQPKSIIPTKALANVLPMSYHFSFYSLKQLWGLQPKHSWLYLDGQPIGYVVGAHSWCGKSCGHHLCTFHTKNMSMIHHSFATCRLCMSGCQGFPFHKFCLYIIYHIHLHGSLTTLDRNRHTPIFGNLSFFLKSKKCCDGNPWGISVRSFTQFRMPRYDPKTWRICDKGKSFLETGRFWNQVSRDPNGMKHRSKMKPIVLMVQISQGSQGQPPGMDGAKTIANNGDKRIPTSTG